MIWCWLLISMILPNSVFWVVSHFTHTLRPWFNLDYVWIAMLFCLPRWWWRLLAVVALCCTFIADCLLLVTQLFPINSFTGALHLLPSVFKGPVQYQLLLLLALVWLVIVLLIDLYQPRQTWIKPRLLFGLVVLFVGFIGSALGGERVVQSQLIHYYQGTYNGFLVGGNDDARMAGAGAKSLSLQLLPHSHSDKILLVVDESWGFTQDPQLQEAVLEQILAERGRFEFFEHGMKQFNGLTLQAELKELCQIHLESSITSELKTLTSQDFADCLPHQLQQRGYTTYGLHGSTGSFYDRADWYPKAGFQHRQFVENMSSLPRCGAFNGVCDHALFAEVKKMLLAQPKTFVHWMTLTTHFPYEAKDITDKRLQCRQFGLKPDGNPCRNLMLHAQFFDQMAIWLQDPALKGLEVVVIGDHEPPMLDRDERDKVFQPAGVSWLHFKVK